jgi:hypothetical protein
VVVRAAKEVTARDLAQSVAGNEGRGVYRRLGANEDEIASDVWLDAALTECVLITEEGEASVILVDVWEG